MLGQRWAKGMRSGTPGPDRLRAKGGARRQAARGEIDERRSGGKLRQAEALNPEGGRHGGRHIARQVVSRAARGTHDERTGTRRPLAQHRASARQTFGR